MINRPSQIAIDSGRIRKRMQSLAPFSPWWLRCARGAMASKDGAAAVEFAIAAVPFFYLLFAIIEVGLIFVANISLSNATFAMARQLRTGRIVAQGNSATGGTGAAMNLANFKIAICNQMPIVPNSVCLAQLQVDVRTLSSFSGQSPPSPTASNTFNNASLCYFSGSGGSIVEFRAFYLWQINTPLLFSALVNTTTYTSNGTTTSGNYYVLNSAEVFKVEQKSAGANTGSGC